MNQYIKQFIIGVGICGAALFVIWIILLFILPTAWLSPAIPVMIPFFIIITIGVYYLMLKASDNKFSRFVNSFMILTLGKILFFSVIIVVYVLLNRADALSFILTFFILYLVFTIFEITAFLRDVKRMGK